MRTKENSVVCNSLYHPVVPSCTEDYKGFIRRQSMPPEDKPVSGIHAGSQFFVLGWVGGDMFNPVNILGPSCICPFALSVRSPDFTNFSLCVRLFIVCLSITATSPHFYRTCAADDDSRVRVLYVPYHHLVFNQSVQSDLNFSPCSCPSCSCPSSSRLQYVTPYGNYSTRTVLVLLVLVPYYLEIVLSTARVRIQVPYSYEYSYAASRHDVRTGTSSDYLQAFCDLQRSAIR